MAQYRNYLVKLTRDQVVHRLRARVGVESILGFLDPTDKVVVGTVKPDRFRLRVPRGFTANAFAPYLYGRIEPRPEGARLRTRLSMNPFATGIVIVGVASMVGASLAGLLGIPVGSSTVPNALGFASGSVIFGGFVWLIRQIDRSHEEILWRFVESAFQDVLL
jgi:hypothetical protein